MKNYFLLILLLVSLINFSSAQYNSDSLEIVLSKSKEDTTRSRILNILAWSYKSSDSKKSREYANEALRLANKHDLDIEKGASLNTIGALYYFVKNLDSALICYNQAVAFFEKANRIDRISRCRQNIAVVYSDKSEYNKAMEIYKDLLHIYQNNSDSTNIANIYNNIGNAYNLMGNYDLALTNFIKAIEIYEKIGAKDNQSTVLYNLGALQYYKGDNKKAMEYCEQSLKIRKEINNPYGIAYSYILKGAIYQADSMIEEAIDVYQKALKMEEELGDKQGISSLLVNISNCYLIQNKYEDARKFSLDALKIANELGIIKLQLSIYNVLGELEIKLKNYKAAISILDKCASLADSTGDKQELKNAYKGLSIGYSANGDYKNGYKYLQMHMDIKDTLFNEEKNRQLTEMETKYQSVQKEKEIELLNKDKELQNVEIGRQKFIIYSTIGGLFLVLIFTFFLFRLYSQKKRMNVVLANQNEEILQKNEEITAQRDEIEAQRDEITNQHEIVILQKNKIEIIHKEVTDSINYAKRIQRATLPKLELIKENFSDYFIFYKPRDIVSGDFYWAAKVENQLILTVADCTGHGVPGGFMSMLGMSILKEIVIKEYITHSGLILKRMRKEIINALQQKGVDGEQKDGMDMALISIDTDSKILSFSGANNPLYIVRKVESEKFIKQGSETLNKNELSNFMNFKLEELKGDKMPIAIHEHMEPFAVKEFQLIKDDCIYLMSDGFVDQFGGPNNKKFKSKKFKEELQKINELTMAEQLTHIDSMFNTWKGNNEQTDDIAILGIKV